MGEPFGVLPDGRPVTRHVLGGGRLRLGVLDLGATVQSLLVAGVPVVLGFDSADGYVAAADDCFGGVAGRYANRIGGAELELDGVRHRLSANDGAHTLHGGADGFHRRLWDVESLDASQVTLALTSPDGDQGFPGRLTVRVTYVVDDDEVRIGYAAESEAPTVVNLTNHAYFNLAGAGSGTVEDHLLSAVADTVVLTDGDQIPTGELADVAGTPFDFRTPHPIGARLRVDHSQLLLAHGYDHSLVLRSEGLRPAATLRDPGSGRTLELLTDQPALHLYTANYLDGSHVGAQGTAYRQGDGVAMETQHLPDSPHHPGFPSTVLRPGETFRSTTVWRLLPV